MHLKFINDMKEVEELRQKEKIMCEQEVMVNKQITEQTLEKNKKLIEEITKLKGILKVPRLHYKNIERLDWDNISR
jgi:hypothetical protein